jgi:anti-sigma-K factor RskA
MEHRELENLAAPYALGRLTPEERRAFEAHAASCPSCAKMAQDYKATVSLLPLAAEQLEPPSALKSRILRAAEAEVKRPAPKPAAQPRKGWLAGLFGGPMARPAPYALAAALAIVAVVGLSVWSVQLNRAKNDRERELSALRSSRTLAIAKGTEPQSAARGEVVRLEAEGKTVLRVSGLPALPSGQTYQMWLIKDGAPVSAGLFQVSSPGTLTESIITGDYSKAQVFAVTVEKAGGVAQPTGSIVLKADL